MQLIAYIQDSETTRKILESLKISTAPPSVYMPEEYQVSYAIEATHNNAEYLEKPIKPIPSVLFFNVSW